MDVGVRRLAVGQFQGGNAERPDVGFAIVARLLNHLRRHPERGPHECVLLSHGCRELPRNTEIRKLDLATGADKDVGS